MSAVPATKDAVIFILDANLTMNSPYPSVVDEKSSSRLFQSKEAILVSMIDLMWKTKMNEVGIVVLKAGLTHHHHGQLDSIYDDADLQRFFERCKDGTKLDRYRDDCNSEIFKNIVEFDLKRPNKYTLQAVRDIQCTINEEMEDEVEGDFCAGLVVAADELYRRTKGKKYNRKVSLVSYCCTEVSCECVNCVFTDCFDF